MIFTLGQPQGRVDPQITDVIAIFVTGSYLVKPLTHHLDQTMFSYEQVTSNLPNNPSWGQWS